jgi:hypothetical protein
MFTRAKLLLKGYFLAQCKVAHTILILKPGKPPNELTSYRPTSLLSTVTKVLEELLKMLLPKVESNGLIPNISSASGRGTPQ